MIDRRAWTALLCALTVIVLSASAAYAGEGGVNRVNGIYVCQSYNDQKQLYVSDVFTVNVEQDTLNAAYSRADEVSREGRHFVRRRGARPDE